MMRHFLNVVSVVGGAYLCIILFVYIYFKLIKNDLRFYKVGYFRFAQEPVKIIKKDLK